MFHNPYVTISWDIDVIQPPNELNIIIFSNETDLGLIIIIMHVTVTTKLKRISSVNWEISVKRI